MKPKIVEPQYCDWCAGIITEERSKGRFTKYCSRACSQTAGKRRSSARLGIPPARSAVSKLSNPLYFD